MRIYTKFKIHAEAFEACQMGLLDAKAAPTFPQEFSSPSKTEFTSTENFIPFA